jgi:hypothetical protein
MAISKEAAKKLRALFLDAHCVVYLKDMDVITSDAEGQDVRISAMTDGIILDIDVDLIYLGTLEGGVTKTIAHETGQIIEYVIEGNEFNANMPVDGDMH